MAVDLGWPAADRRLRAMGTDCHVVVVGPGPESLADQALAHIEELEQRWSRFLPSSEVTRVNQANGSPVAVSSETLTLFERAVLAYRLTDGRFNPLMGRRIAELGYDRPFESMNSDSSGTSSAIQASDKWAAVNGLSWEAVDIDRTTGTIRLAQGLSFDPGGIGKGLAADLVSEALMTAGAWGALVNLGGDLRVRGVPPTGDAWVVEIKEPALSTERISTVRLSDAGLATSTTARRRWQTGSSEAAEQMHHILDPKTGLPASGPVLASVIAGDAWWAEASATALCAGRLPIPMAPDGHCAALFINEHGPCKDRTTERRGGFEEYEQLLEKHND